MNKIVSGFFIFLTIIFVLTIAYFARSVFANKLAVSGLNANNNMKLNNMKLARLQPVSGNANNTNTDRFKVYGLVCGDTYCITSIQRALYKINGVISATVDMENQEAIVKFHGNISPKVFINAIDSASNAMFHYEAHYIK
ncbi:MAG: heavy-metal-associated domain-containing protein [bacterium]